MAKATSKNKRKPTEEKQIKTSEEQSEIIDPAVAQATAAAQARLNDLATKAVNSLVRRFSNEVNFIFTTDPVANGDGVNTETNEYVVFTSDQRLDIIKEAAAMLYAQIVALVLSDEKKDMKTVLDTASASITKYADIYYKQSASLKKAQENATTNPS